MFRKISLLIVASMPFLVAALLVFAATAKLISYCGLVVNGTHPSLFSVNSPALIFGEVSLAFGIAFQPMRWWVLCAVVFCAFISYSMYQAIKYVPSCGCLGQLEVSPLAMLVIDCCALVAMVLFGLGSTKKLYVSAVESIRSAFVLIAAVGGGVLVNSILPLLGITFIIADITGADEGRWASVATSLFLTLETNSLERQDLRHVAAACPCASFSSTNARFCSDSPAKVPFELNEFEALAKLSSFPRKRAVNIDIFALVGERQLSWRFQREIYFPFREGPRNLSTHARFQAGLAPEPRVHSLTPNLPLSEVEVTNFGDLDCRIEKTEDGAYELTIGYPIDRVGLFQQTFEITGKSPDVEGPFALPVAVTWRVQSPVRVYPENLVVFGSKSEVSEAGTVTLVSEPERDSDLLEARLEPTGSGSVEVDEKRGGLQTVKIEVWADNYQSDFPPRLVMVMRSNSGSNYSIDVPVTIIGDSSDSRSSP